MIAGGRPGEHELVVVVKIQEAEKLDLCAVAQVDPGQRWLAGWLAGHRNGILELTHVLVKSYRNGVGHNTGRFARDILPFFLLCPVITFLECHTIRAGGRPNFAKKKRGCYDHATSKRLNQHTRKHTDPFDCVQHPVILSAYHQVCVAKHNYPCAIHPL